MVLLKRSVQATFLLMHSARRAGFLISGCLLAGLSLWLATFMFGRVQTADISTRPSSATLRQGATMSGSFHTAAVPTRSASPSRSASPTLSVSPTLPVSSTQDQSATDGPVVSPVKPVGYNAHVASQPDPSSYVDLIESGGATSLRDNVIWGTVEPTDGHFDWSQPDVIVAQAAIHHLHVLLVVGAAPVWASGVPASDDNQPWLPPASAATYGAFAGMVAARYSAGGEFWKLNPSLPEYLPAGLELWNEENVTGFWGGQTPDPQLYADMVKAAYTSIKHADPMMTVVTGGLASIGGYDDVACTGTQGTTGSNTTEWNGLNYLQALYADGIHGYFDAVGWHPYTFSNSATASQMLSYNLCSGWSQMAFTPVSVRSLMTAYGDAGKQVWITEIGAPSCISGATYECVSPTQEASLAEQEAQMWSGLEWAGGFYWYDIRDDQDGTQNVESHFGAVSYPDSPKPVYQALEQAWN